MENMRPPIWIQSGLKWRPQSWRNLDINSYTIIFPIASKKLDTSVQGNNYWTPIELKVDTNYLLCPNNYPIFGSTVGRNFSIFLWCMNLSMKMKKMYEKFKLFFFLWRLAIRCFPSGMRARRRLEIGQHTMRCFYLTLMSFLGRLQMEFWEQQIQI